jgi:hypothetical protein
LVIEGAPEQGSVVVDAVENCALVMRAAINEGLQTLRQPLFQGYSLLSLADAVQPCACC